MTHADVRVYEVGPRDGLQNESRPIPTVTKLRFIDLLADAGLREIEATSFVSPGAIPQLADADELMAGIRRILETMPPQPAHFLWLDRVQAEYGPRGRIGRV